MESEDGKFVINGKNYNLKVHGKTVCPSAFASLHGISFNTLSSLLTEESVSIEIPLV